MTLSSRPARPDRVTDDKRLARSDAALSAAFASMAARCDYRNKTTLILRPQCNYLLRHWLSSRADICAAVTRAQTLLARHHLHSSYRPSMIRCLRKRLLASTLPFRSPWASDRHDHLCALLPPSALSSQTRHGFKPAMGHGNRATVPYVMIRWPFIFQSRRLTASMHVGLGSASYLGRYPTE
jgi:hypothetical protein